MISDSKPAWTTQLSPTSKMNKYKLFPLVLTMAGSLKNASSPVQELTEEVT